MRGSPGVACRNWVQRTLIDQLRDLNLKDVNENVPLRRWMWTLKNRGKRYKQLDDPFSEEEEDEETFLLTDEAYAIIAGDELTSLQEAKVSPDWPEWDKAMSEQPDLLKEMGTWKLVPKAVAISK